MSAMSDLERFTDGPIPDEARRKARRLDRMTLAERAQESLPRLLAVIESHRAALADPRCGLDRSIVGPPEVFARERRSRQDALRRTLKVYNAAVSTAQGAGKSEAA